MANKIHKGKWSWNPDLLISKIEIGEVDECWRWLGARAPHANLFGAYKNNRPQMTQSSRLIWMTVHDEDVSDLEVKHSCGNRWCCNVKHMFTQPNHMFYHRDGRPLGTPKPEVKRQQVPTKKFTAVDKVQEKTKRLQWWQL
jgi:hypothetical protein